MNKRRMTTLPSRRDFFASATAGLATWAVQSSVLAQPPVAKDDMVSDRLWVFACAANSDFPHLGRRSVMTPAESAFYLDVPNIIVVQSSTTEAPYGRLEPRLRNTRLPCARCSGLCGRSLVQADSIRTARPRRS